MLDLRKRTRDVLSLVESATAVNQLLGQPLPFSDDKGERLTLNDVLSKGLPFEYRGRSLMVGDVMGKALPPIRRAFRPRPGDRMWIDEPNALQLLERKTRDPLLREHTRNIIQNGYTRLSANVEHELCDRLVSDFHKYCEDNRDAATDYRDQHGYHERLVNFHLSSSAALQVGMNPTVLRLLDFMFGYRTVVYTSLTFEKGSQQDIHQDAPFFRTEPEGFFFGVWTALEDVHPEAGPLNYYVGGHRVQNIDRTEILERVGGDHGKGFHTWNAEVAAECEKRGLRKESAGMKKGDTLIWHPFLPHGGKKIQDPKRTRKSVVFHYLPQHVVVHPLASFLDPANNIDAKKTYQMIKRWGREYVDAGAPVFNHNY